MRLFPARPLLLLAWLNVVIHGIALVLAEVGMRPGSPLVDLPERLAYLADSPLGWSLGWGSWILCALALVAFMANLAEAASRDRSQLNYAMMLAGVGAVVDVVCDTVQLQLPQFASLTEVTFFLGLERAAGFGGLVIANGAYTLAVLLATLHFRDWPGRRPGLVRVGFGVVVFGTVLVEAGLMGSAVLAALATGPTIVLYCLWVLLVAWSVEGLGKKP